MLQSLLVSVYMTNFVTEMVALVVSLNLVHRMGNNEIHW